MTSAFSSIFRRDRKVDILSLIKYEWDLRHALSPFVFLNEYRFLTVYLIEAPTQRCFPRFCVYKKRYEKPPNMIKSNDNNDKLFQPLTIDEERWILNGSTSHRKRRRTSWRYWRNQEDRDEDRRIHVGRNFEKMLLSGQHRWMIVSIVSSVRCHDLSNVSDHKLFEISSENHPIICSISVSIDVLSERGFIHADLLQIAMKKVCLPTTSPWHER